MCVTACQPPVHCWESGDGWGEMLSILGLFWGTKLNFEDDEWGTVDNKCQTQFFKLSVTSLQLQTEENQWDSQSGSLWCSVPSVTQCVHVCISQKQALGQTSGLLLAQSLIINFYHIVKTFTAVGSPAIPPTKPTEVLTNPQWWILPSALPAPNHLESMDSNYTECAGHDWKLSTHITSRCRTSFYNIFIALLNVIIMQQ